MQNLKEMLQMSLFTKQKQTHKLRERTCVVRGEGWREGIVREFGIVMYTLLYLKWTTSKVLLHSTENSVNAVWQSEWEGTWGENGYMYMYGWVPLLAMYGMLMCCWEYMEDIS